MVNPHGDQTFALAAAFASTNAARTTISLLQENINATPRQIGTAVSEALDRNWSKGSKQRNGQALRKWVFVLYPNIRRPKLGDKGYAKSLSLNEQVSNKGRPKYISEELLRAVFDQLDPPYHATKVANLLDVNPETVRRFKRANPEIWSQIFDCGA